MTSPCMLEVWTWRLHSFFGQSESTSGASASPNDVVPSPSEALEPPESFTQRVDFSDGTNFNFSNLLSNAMRNTAACYLVLPWKTDEWSWLFSPDSDIMTPYFLRSSLSLKL